MDIRELVLRCMRLLLISRKPTDEEFQKVAKVTGLGMIVIGIVGVVLAGIFSLI